MYCFKLYLFIYVHKKYTIGKRVPYNSVPSLSFTIFSPVMKTYTYRKKMYFLDGTVNVHPLTINMETGGSCRGYHMYTYIYIHIYIYVCKYKC